MRAIPFVTPPPLPREPFAAAPNAACTFQRILEIGMDATLFSNSITPHRSAHQLRHRHMALSRFMVEPDLVLKIEVNHRARHDVE